MTHCLIETCGGDAVDASTRNARDVFLAAIKLPTQERGAYVQQACGDNQDLHQRVSALLQAQTEIGTFHEVSALTVDQPITESPGTVIGPYKLQEQIGEGGFGVVFMAEQTKPVRRKVALKILKPGMDTRQVIARFEAERQALALMDHPNIAHVFDGGETASGRPYFVMELIRGIPITDFADQSHLPVRDRLELFKTVCQAVQHAHQKGIIHRDLKPSNVMVTLHDEKPVVKVIDFGIAKATGEQLTDKTLFTNFAQMIGTPMYMSPEQAQMGGLDIDTRSDIYSLGVLLYELLTGTTPFDRGRLRNLGYDEVRRIIREEEPARPSTRISTLGQASATVSAERQSNPRQLRQSLQGELDWIVMKALEKDRERRYETASGLARDIERYLQNEPVRACPPSTWYRFRKFALRNRALLGTMFAVSAALVMAVMVLVVSIVVIDRERADAMAQRDNAQVQRQRARRAVDKMFTDVAEKWLAQQPHLEPMQRQFLEEALHFYEEFAQELSTDPELRLERVNAHRRVGQIRLRLGERPLAERAIRQAIDLSKQLISDFPSEPRYRSALAECHESLGYALVREGRFGEAEKEVRESLLLRDRLVADAPAVAAYCSDLASGCSMLGDVQVNSGRPCEAQLSYHQAIALVEQLPVALADTAECRGCLAGCRQGLFFALSATGQSEEAKRSLRQAVALWEKLAAALPNAPDYQYRLAFALRLLGDVHPSEAEQAYRRALLISQKLAANFPSVTDYRWAEAVCSNDVGRALNEAGRPQEAVDFHRRAIQLWQKLVKGCPAMSEYRCSLALSHHLLGEALCEARQPQEADTSYCWSVKILSELTGEFSAVDLYSLRLALCYGNLAELLTVYPDATYHNAARALELAKKAVKLRPDVRQAWNALGIAHYRVKDWKAAVSALEESIELGEGGYWFDWFFLAMAHWQLGHKVDAHKWYSQAAALAQKEQQELAKNKPMEARYHLYRAEAAKVLGLAAKVK
jgi:serine/threonine protein kinase/Flp pilus assembly protein TadD